MGASSERNSRAPKLPPEIVTAKGDAHHIGTMAQSRESGKGSAVGQIRARAHVKDKGITVTALVDTGAALSCVSEATVRRAGWDLQPWSGGTLIGADQQPIRVVGQVELLVGSDDESKGAATPWTFAVVSHLVKPMVLGADVLTHLGASVNLQEGRVDSKTLTIRIGRDKEIGAISRAKPEPEPPPVAEDSDRHGADFRDVLVEHVISRDHVIEAAGSWDALGRLITDHRTIFAADPSKPGRSGTTVHEIKIDEAVRVPRAAPSRVAPAIREEIKAQVKEMLDAGIVRPSRSPFASRVVMVSKKGTTKRRFCVDYRALNDATVKDAYPMTRIDDALEAMHGAVVFSTMDLASGYWQVPMNKDDVAKTAFVTMDGLYEFVVMPFGLCNAPATFQRMMDGVLRGLPFCRVYIDDVIVYSRNRQEHLGHLQTVFKRVREAGLHLKISKCKFARAELPFLGHVVSERGVEPDPEKVSAVRRLQPPRDVAELRSFLGMASYYRRFVRNFATIAEPLHALTRKDTAYAWSTEANGAFTTLRDALAKAPVLAYPDPAAPYTIQTDASGVGVGAVLSQTVHGAERPVSFFSRSLSSAQRNYSAFDRECLAVVEAVNHFRPYVDGSHFKVVTDHHALKWLRQVSLPDGHGRLARWVAMLQDFDMEIEHRKGVDNGNADGLSRVSQPALPLAPLAVRMPDVGPTSVDVTAQEQRADTSLAPLFAWASSDTVPSDGRLVQWASSHALEFLVRDGRLLARSRTDPLSTLLVVPTSLRRAVMAEHHDSPFGGHLGEAKTWGRMARRFAWPGMSADVRRFVASCQVCQRRKTPRVPASGAMQPIRVTDPWSMVAMDFVGPLPETSRGNKYLLVFTDHATRLARAVPTADMTAETTAQALLHEIICLFGAPQRLLSDRGANFVGQVVAAVCQSFKIMKMATTAYHPQTDGLTERFNGTIGNMLATAIESTRAEWDSLVPYLVFAYNTTPQASTRESPFFLTFGREAYLPSDVTLGLQLNADEAFTDAGAYKAHLIDMLSTSRRAAVAHSDVAHERQREEYNRRHRDVRYNVGDLVWLYVPAVEPGRATKFALNWRGPYRVTRVASPVTYALTDSQGHELSQLVNVARLKPCISRDDRPSGTRAPAVLQEDDFDPALEGLDRDQDASATPPARAPAEDVPDTRIQEANALPDGFHYVKKIRAARKVGRTKQYLIEWDGYPLETDFTWEPTANIPPKIIREYQAARGRAPVSQRGE